ncbi:MAG: RdgB/HAM1 family non-canonical purine NTP pyrophosphatase [Blastochloris viridis]|uniref:dITP/XTP pyrophosphatase n=1 Tax=Blastochloris viridis TaxID=1079 RepID=A0A6N4R602_BLAVI|nr:MAG: RdgB/HAM1 family non-canonical purine NTP pyrophosphatase [Blastochloris viridis]
MTLNAPNLLENRPQRGETLLLATHNVGKARELETLLSPFGFRMRTLAEEGLPAPEETGTTFHANAELKATQGRLATGCWTLADDSGLKVLTLNGAPGVDTAHYGGWEKLLNALKETPEKQRQARFVCVLALQSPQGVTTFFEGVCEGVITLDARGEKGFGYDPVFRPEGQLQTFAEMTAEAKHSFSHRGAALRQPAAWLES